MSCAIHPDMQEVVLLIIVQMVYDNKFVETLSAIANDDDDAFRYSCATWPRIYACNYSQIRTSWSTIQMLAQNLSISFKRGDEIVTVNRLLM